MSDYEDDQADEGVSDSDLPFAPPMLQDETETALSVYEPEPKPEPKKPAPARPAAAPVQARAGSPGGTSPRDDLIAVLTGGRGLTARQKALLDATQVGFSLTDNDPFWIVALPALLESGSSNIDEIRDLIRELIANGANSRQNDDISSAIESVSESQREAAHAINAMTNRLKTQVERAVEAAIAKIGEDQEKQSAVKIDSEKIAQSVTSAVLPRLLPVRFAWAVTAVAFIGAISFAGGVFLNKSGYDKLVDQLESKIQVYEQALAGQGGGKK